MLRGESEGYQTYENLLAQGSRYSMGHLYKIERKVLPHLVCNLQFTSGTTGLPKAAMLTHQSVSQPSVAFPLLLVHVQLD